MDRIKRSLASYCFHQFLALPVTIAFGYFLQWIVEGLAGVARPGSHGWLIPAFTGLAGFGVTLFRRDRASILVPLLPALVFFESWRELYEGWSPSWSKFTREAYVHNNLYGPLCGDTECLYTIGWAIFQPALFYSLGALAGMCVGLKLPHSPD